MAWDLHAIEQTVTGTTSPSIPVVDEKSSSSRDRKFLNEDGTREGEKGLTKSRRLELLAFSGIRQELGQSRLGDIRSVREVVGAVVVEVE